MRTLELLPEASDEAASAVAYYEERARGLDARLRKEIETAAASILEDPYLWRECRGAYRRLNLAGFPFYIAYFLRERTRDRRSRRSCQPPPRLLENPDFQDPVLALDAF
jgi:plasmid stabilization system protein ParE